MGGDGLLCSSRRAVSFSGLRYSVALSMMAPVLRSNWMYLPRVDCASAVAMVGFVSTMMLGVRCWKLSAFREVGINKGWRKAGCKYRQRGGGWWWGVGGRGQYLASQNASICMSKPPPPPDFRRCRLGRHAYSGVEGCGRGQHAGSLHEVRPRKYVLYICSTERVSLLLAEG